MSRDSLLEARRLVIQSIMRFVYVALGMAALVGILRLDLSLSADPLSETALTEMTQEALLAVSAVCFGWLARQFPQQRGFYILVAGFFSTMLIRELDALFDLIRHGFWVYPATLTVLASILTAARFKETTLEAFASFLRTPQSNTIIYGLVIVLVFSRLFGMGTLWHGVMGSDYLYIVKSVVEEGTELLGYGFIVCGSLSFALSKRYEMKVAEQCPSQMAALDACSDSASVVAAQGAKHSNMKHSNI